MNLDDADVVHLQHQVKAMQRTIDDQRARIAELEAHMTGIRVLAETAIVGRAT